MRYWLGPWTWSEDVWQSPAGCRGLIDLRPLPAQARAGGTPLGVGLFALDEAADPGPAHVSFGIDPGVPLTVFQRLAWEQRVLGAGRTLAAANLREAVWESLTTQADPTGQDRALPLVPNTRRRAWELRLAGQLWKARAFDPATPEAPALQTLLQNTYRRLREDTLGGVYPADHHRKVLGGWVRKYAIDYRWFQPADVPDETPLSPETVITESFDQADATTLGPDLTWTEIHNDWETVSSRARKVSGNGEQAGTARADSDLSADDHYAQVQVYGGSATASHGPCARIPGTGAVTWYGTVNYSNTLYLVKMVGGTQTNLANASHTYADGETYRIEADGSGLDALADGSSVVTATDTAITGNTRCGLTSFATGRDLDAFAAGDLSAFDPAAFSHPGIQQPVSPTPHVCPY